MVHFAVGGTLNSYTSNIPLIEGTWFHVVGTFAGGSAAPKIYINGDYDVDVSNIGTANAFLTAGVAIGYDPNTISDSFQGIIDAVAIWNVELNADQVQSLYTNSVN